MVIFFDLIDAKVKRQMKRDFIMYTDLTFCFE